MTKLSQKFSVGIDNFAANYYSKAYTSGESMNGIDDLFTAAEGTTTLVDHEGIVYDAEYPLDPSVNGYVQVNDGEKVCNHILAKRAIDEAERDSVVTVTRTVTSLLPKVPLTLSVSNKALVTFDDSVLDSFFIEEASSGDATTYTVREPNDSDAITLTWLDSFGNAVKTEKLLPGTKPTASDKNVTLYDPETGIGKIIAEWIWDLDGEGSDYESSAISTYNIRDIGKLRGRSVTVEPSLAELTGAAYIAYFKDGDVYRLADLTSNNFKNVNNIEKTVTICPNGTVIKLVFEGDRITLKHNAYYKYENKKITFDLNGKTITRYNTDGFGSALIRIGEGASAIVTSSAPGGRVFLASNRKDTTEGRPNNRIYGSDGLVHTEIGVDSAYIEISDIEFNGGTMVKFCGALTSDDAPSFENDTPIVCNVDNVVAYSPNRASYSVFASLCPDVELNIEDSKFYVTDSNYGIFHDYPASSSTYYHSEMQVKMKNCEVLSYTEGDAPVMCKLWVSMGLNSHMEVEHTKIIANLGGLSAARVKWGAGVEIATDSTKYFDASKVNEGVSYIINDGSLTNELQLSFTRAAFTTAWSYIDTSATPYKYLDTCYTNTETITRSATVTFITYADEDDSQFVGAVDWKDLAGNIVARSYGIVGTRLTAPVDPADYGYHNENTAWYTINYRWLPTTVKKGVTNSILRRGTGVSIRNKQANMSLTTGMVFNLYIPAPDKNIVQDSVYSPQSTGDIEFVTVNGTSMLKIQYSSALDDFAAQSVRIYFSTVSGIRLSYPVNIDPMKYVTALAKEYTCGSEEARLAYQIVAYKKAVAAYLAEAEGKTIDTYLDATELSAISSFESVFAAHTDCKCNSDLYDPESAGGESMDYEAYDAVGISGFAYLLDTESNGLRIDVNEGTAVKSVTYTDSAGIKMIHDESLNNLKLIVTDSARYYAVHGIRASDIAATIAITMSDGSTVTYSLAQYINSTDAAIGKALYSYSSAASAYKNK